MLTTIMIDTEYLLARMKETHKPHRLFKTADGKLFEFISYPWVENGNVYINGRVPGDPLSIRRFEAILCHAEHMDCYCAVAGKDYYLTAAYYQKRDREAQ